MADGDYFHQLAHRDVAIRRQALQALSDQSDPALLKLLIGQPQLFEAELQELLVNIFVRNRSRWAAEIAGELLYATRESMRQLGITILHRLGDVSLKPLNRLQHSANPRVRLGVLQALAGIHSSVRPEWIRPFLADEDIRVVQEAVNLIRQYGDETTVLLLKDPFVHYPELRDSILWAFARYFHPEQLLHYFKAYFVHSEKLLHTFLLILNGYSPGVVNPILEQLVTAILDNENISLLNTIAKHLNTHVDWTLPADLQADLSNHHAALPRETRLSLLAASPTRAFVEFASQWNADTEPLTQCTALYAHRFPELALQYATELPPDLKPIIKKYAAQSLVTQNSPSWETTFAKNADPEILIHILNAPASLSEKNSRNAVYRTLHHFPPAVIATILNQLSAREVKEELLNNYLKRVDDVPAVLSELSSRVNGLGYLLTSYFADLFIHHDWARIALLNHLKVDQAFFIFTRLFAAETFREVPILQTIWNYLSPAVRPAFLLAIINHSKTADIMQLLNELSVDISAETLILTSEFLDLLTLQPTSVQYIFLTLIYYDLENFKRDQ